MGKHRSITPVAAVALAAIVAAVLASCGDGSVGPSASASKQQSSTSVTIPTTTTTTIPHVQQSDYSQYSGSFVIKDTNGNTAGVTLDRGALRHASTMAIGNDVLGSACSVNDTNDAVVPFVLTITNTSSGFPTSPYVNILLANGGSNFINGTQLPLIEAAYNSTNVTCTKEEEYVSPGEDGSFMVSTNSLPPGQRSIVAGFFIAPNYYSTSHPDGDSSDFADVDFAFYFQNQTIVSTSGSLLTGPDGTPAYISFDPTGNGGCYIAQNCPQVQTGQF